MSHDLQKIDAIIAKSPQDPSSLITVLQDIQREFHFLPCEALSRTSEKLSVPLSKVYSASTFYNMFSLTPRGEKIIRVCQGTACHLRGADLVQEQLETGLGITAGETTSNLKFTIEVVSCVGACAMAPVVAVNNKYHGRVRCDQVLRLVQGK